MSGKPLISGTPFMVTDTYDWQDDFENILSRAVASAEDYASKSLRYAASQDEDWAPYKDLLSVEYHEGALHYVLTGTPEQIQAMENLEYGLSGTPPRPLIRPQVQRQSDILGHRIELILAQEAPGAS